MLQQESNKKIVWHPLADVNKLEGEIRFKVEARPVWPKAGETVPGIYTGMEFVFIPEGEYVMGSSVDEPKRDPNELRETAIIRPFYILSTEVTRSMWIEVMGRQAPNKFSASENLPVEKRFPSLK